MRIKKLGFTLAEVLIAMVVIGIIMAMSMQTIKIVKASYTALTYFEFKTIQQIAGEMIAGKLPYRNYDDNGIELEQATTTHYQKNGVPVQVITKDDTLFCHTLISMVNAAGSKNCDALFNSGIEDNEPYISDIDNTAPTFITTAGKRYYLTKWTSNKNVSDEFGYRLLAVDLNGTQAPNITKKAANKIPDIVTFMILDTGEIFPLGVASNNLKTGDGKTILYLNTKLKGYYYSDKAHTGGVPEDCTLKGGKVNKQVCNYAVVFVPNRTKEDNNKLSYFSYREAYCAGLGNKKSAYENYCTGLNSEKLCPPSDQDKQFDICRVENIKPVFRYNF